MTSPARRRQIVLRVRENLHVSERRVRRVLEQPRSTQRYKPFVADDEEQQRSAIVASAGKYGRYGYRRITAPLRPFR